MTNSPKTPKSVNNPDKADSGPSNPPAKKKKKHISMHEGVGVWADCCSCEAEPYWREMAEEMGVDFNEYEEEEFEAEKAEPDSGK